MAVPLETNFRRVVIQSVFLGPSTIDMAFQPPDDGDPNVVHYPDALDDVLNQPFFEILIHNQTTDDIFYSLESADLPVPTSAGGNTVKTIPAGGSIVEETLQRDADSAITRLRIVSQVAGNVEVMLHV